jgi:hypothetical protein
MAVKRGLTMILISGIMFGFTKYVLDVIFTGRRLPYPHAVLPRGQWSWVRGITSDRLVSEMNPSNGKPGGFDLRVDARSGLVAYHILQSGASCRLPKTPRSKCLALFNCLRHLTCPIQHLEASPTITLMLAQFNVYMLLP